MKKWLPFIPLLLLGILMLASSCKEKPDPPTYYIPEEYKSYIEFHPGSYWVYEDSATGALDSVVVVNYYESLAEYLDEKDNVAWYSESISTECRSFFKSQTSFIQSSVNCAGLSGGTNCCLTSRRTDAAGEGDQFQLAQYPFETGYLPDGTGQCVFIYSSYAVDSLTFGPVVKTLVPSDYTEYGNTSYYYFAKDAGIVRLETLNDSGVWRIWKLKKYLSIR